MGRFNVPATGFSAGGRTSRSVSAELPDQLLATSFIFVRVRAQQKEDEGVRVVVGMSFQRTGTTLDKSSAL